MVRPTAPTSSKIPKSAVKGPFMPPDSYTRNSGTSATTIRCATTTTFVAGLRADGLVAPMVVDGAMNGDLFVAYARQVLVPVLRAGDIVVMDNLSSHKRVAAVRAIEEVGCSVVYLPPYSPDLNPIELAFAKIKARLRAAELRTIDKVENFFGTVHEFKPDECRAYIRHTGYTATH